MCLIGAKRVLENKPRIGYKVVIRKRDHYLSMYHGFRYKVGGTYTSHVTTYNHFEGMIVSEAIHLFQDLKTAREFNNFYDCSILELRILDDAEIYSGTDECGRPCYAVGGVKVLREL